MGRAQIAFELAAFAALFIALFVAFSYLSSVWKDASKTKSDSSSAAYLLSAFAVQLILAKAGGDGYYSEVGLPASLSCGSDYNLIADPAHSTVYVAFGQTEVSRVLPFSSFSSLNASAGSAVPVRNSGGHVAFS